MLFKKWCEVSTFYAKMFNMNSQPFEFRGQRGHSGTSKSGRTGL